MIELEYMYSFRWCCCCYYYCYFEYCAWCVRRVYSILFLCIITTFTCIRQRQRHREKITDRTEPTAIAFIVEHQKALKISGLLQDSQIEPKPKPKPTGTIAFVSFSLCCAFALALIPLLKTNKMKLINWTNLLPLVLFHTYRLVVPRYSNCWSSSIA